MKFLAFAAAAAANHNIKADMMSFVKAPNMLQSLMQTVTHPKVRADPGVPSFEQCDDDLGVFTFDDGSTTVDPNPITKGSTINFNLVGGFSESTAVDNLHVHVLWNDSPLYDEDDKDGNTYDADYQFPLSWDVPTFAPDGHYAITLTGTTPEGQKAICISAAFDF